MDGVGGVSAWYLPAKDEVDMVYRYGGVIGGCVRGK